MLLDWPQQKRQITKVLHETIRIASRHGVVAEVPSFTLYEGNRAMLIYPGGGRQELPMKEAESKATIDRREVRVAGPEAVAAVVRQLARGLGDQMERDLIQRLEGVDPRHGGRFGGKDDEEVFQDLMRGLEEMEMTFDESGRPSIFFLAHPDNALKLQALNTPERQKKVDKLIGRKRDEWLRRESDRRLVD